MCFLPVPLNSGQKTPIFGPLADQITHDFNGILLVGLYYHLLDLCRRKCADYVVPELVDAFDVLRC